MSSIHRRELLAGVAGLVLSGLQGRGAVGRNLKVQSPNPEDFEMEAAGLTSYLTPNESFFVRTHTYKATVDAASYRLKIHGLVEKPLTLSLAELKAMPRTDLIAVLECAGNGRSNYRPAVPGLQWSTGAVGNAKWTGVRLKDVLAKAGVKNGATDIAFNGADAPIGTMPDFVRSLPVTKCMHPDTLLAWEMNGQPIPVSHGFPVRLVAPGWAGDSWVKWVQDLELIDHEYEGFFMKTAYRHPVKPVAPGSAVDPKDMTPVTWLGIKSAIAGPTKIAAGRTLIHGTAWGGEKPVAKVDISIDDGQTWKPARLSGARTDYGWRIWSLPATLRDDSVLVVRATDEAGKTQPTEQQWNPSGYLYNVQTRLTTVAPRTVPSSPYPREVKTACLTCHDDHMMTGQHLTRAQWEKEVDKMTKWGAPVDPASRPAIVDFLANQFSVK